MRHPVLSAAPRRAVLLGLLLWIGVAGGEAVPVSAHLVVIAHPDLAGDRFAGRDLADIFRRKLTVNGAGQRLVPVNLPGDHPLREAFSLAVFHLRPADMETYWNERYFHGVSPPYVVNSVEAMLRFVASTPGAIGYVPDCAVDARVQVVARLDASAACPLAVTPP